MGPLTHRTPKHLLEVAGEPFLVHQLRWLAGHGVRDVVLATSYLARAFAPVLGDGGRLGVRLRYAVEPTPRGTGGGVASAARLLDTPADAPLVVVNGDLLTRHDLSAQLALARGRGEPPDAVLHLRSVPDARRYGCVLANADGVVTAFLEKSPAPPSHEVNGGTYVLRRSVLDGIPDGVVSLERDVLPDLVARGRVLAHREQGLWEDVGTPAALVRASRVLVESSGAGARVDPTAVVDASATLSGGSAIGPWAVVEAGATVLGSVVMRGARVSARAGVRDCIVGPGAVIPGGTLLEGGVVC
jgi:mannose-1-phosphate guanylyltransferase